MAANEFEVSGELTAVEPLRYTPAGVPLMGFRLLHRSQQVEAGVQRQVECEIPGVALADTAVGMSGLRIGDAVRVTGFLDRKSRASAQLILHAIRMELTKETHHGDGKIRQGQGQG